MIYILGPNGVFVKWTRLETQYCNISCGHSHHVPDTGTDGCSAEIFQFINKIISDNASRECDADGFWSPTTDYSDCVCNSTEECVNGTDVPLMETSAALEISIIIYFIGKHQLGISWVNWDIKVKHFIRTSLVIYTIESWVYDYWYIPHLNFLTSILNINSIIFSDILPNSVEFKISKTIWMHYWIMIWD